MITIIYYYTFNLFVYVPIFPNIKMLVTIIKIRINMLIHLKPHNFGFLYNITFKYH